MTAARRANLNSHQDSAIIKHYYFDYVRTEALMKRRDGVCELQESSMSASLLWQKVVEPPSCGCCTSCPIVICVINVEDQAANGRELDLFFSLALYRVLIKKPVSVLPQLDDVLREQS